MTSVQYTQRVPLEQTVTFEREAIPWIDDVYRFALSLTRDESDADDVVQDTFLRAFRSWHTYLPGSDCRRWLFTICRNVFLRSRERARPMVELESGELDLALVGSLHNEGSRDSVDSIFSRLDLAPAIAAALATVPEPFRSTLVIVDVEDQSYEAAAEILRVPDRDGSLASVPRASADAGAADDVRPRRGLRVVHDADRSAPNRLSRRIRGHQVAATGFQTCC